MTGRNYHVVAEEQGHVYIMSREIVNGEPEVVAEEQGPDAMSREIAKMESAVVAKEQNPGCNIQRKHQYGTCQEDSTKISTGLWRVG